MCFDKRHHLTLRRLQPAGPTLVSIRSTPALIATLQRLNEEKEAGWQNAPPGQSNREETPRDEAHADRRPGNRPAPTGRACARPMRR